MADAPVVIFCDQCGAGINLVAKERVWKCKKCNSQVCTHCYSTADSTCSKCAAPVRARKVAQEEKAAEESRSAWRRFILGTFSNMDLDGPFREKLAAGILSSSQLKAICIEQGPVDGILSAWIEKKDYGKTLHTDCVITTRTAIMIVEATQSSGDGSVHVGKAEVILKKDISTAVFVPGKGGLLSTYARIELGVGSSARPLRFHHDRKSLENVNSRVSQICSSLGR